MPDPRVRILVVDDDPDIRANLADILADVGYEVDTASGGEEALALVRDRAYDIALLDLKMPGMDGLELYRRIKEIRAGTVAIIVSAYIGGETASTALNEGAWRLLPKPVDFSKLLAMIEEALEQPLVILVDDDAELCASLWDLLRERDFRVCIAHSLQETRERIADRNHQLALIDMKLPDADGLSVLRTVREMSPLARIVLITGLRSQMQERIDQAIAEGAEAVCYKPFDPHALVETMRSLIERRSVGTADKRE